MLDFQDRMHKLSIGDLIKYIWTNWGLWHPCLRSRKKKHLAGSSKNRECATFQKLVSESLFSMYAFSFFSFYFFLEFCMQTTKKDCAILEDQETSWLIALCSFWAKGMACLVFNIKVGLPSITTQFSRSRLAYQEGLCNLWRQG